MLRFHKIILITFLFSFVTFTTTSPSAIPSHIASNSLILKCRVHTLNRCERHCHVCESEHLNVTSPNTCLTEVTGFSVRNVAFSNNVVRLSINNQICRFLPSDTDRFFPQLETLRVWSSQLRRLVQADIRGFEHLRELILPLNEIESLDSDLFQFNTRITKVDLSRNRLKNVGLALFAPVSKALAIINFNHNECIDDNLRGALETFSEKVRKSCPPTMEMLQSDVVFLIEQNERLKLTIEAKDAIIGESCDFSKFSENNNNKLGASAKEEVEMQSHNYEHHIFEEIEFE